MAKSKIIKELANKEIRDALSVNPFYHDIATIERFAFGDSGNISLIIISLYEIIAFKLHSKKLKTLENKQV